MKRKNGRPRPIYVRVFEYILLIFVGLGILPAIVGVASLCQLSNYVPNQAIRSTESFVEEILVVPLNSQEPVYTENEYSDRVAISVSGSVERNGEFFFDAMHLYEDLEQGSQDGYPAFLIDGSYVVFRLTPTPKYRDDHIYRFPYSVFRNIRDTNLHRPRTIGFQIISEAATGLDGEFVIEVSSDPFKYWPRSRGT